MSDELHEEETGETKESKSDAMHRLKKAGLWDEATKYRDERRIRYRNFGGLTKKESSERAWDDMRRKYPPPGVEPVEPPDIEMPEPVLLNLAETPEPEDIVHIPGVEGSMDVGRDVQWAYEHISDGKIRADQAPSGGAWSMLIYGREARHKFLELVTKYDLSAGNKDDEEAEALRADAADHSKALQKLRAITKKVHADSIRQAPNEVERVLRKAGWDVTRPAEEPLETRAEGGVFG